MGRYRKKEEKAQIKSLYENGKRIPEIARICDANYREITKILSEMGASLPEKVQIDEIEIINMRSAGMTKKHIAAYYGLTLSEFNRRLSEENLEELFSRGKVVKPDTVEAHMAKCKDCQFRGNMGGIGNYCNYLGIMGFSRACTVNECEKHLLPKRN